MRLTESKKLKMQLVAAAAMFVVSVIAVAAATLAWFINNNTVEGTTSTISASSDDTVLQIVQGLTPDHGSSSTVVAVEGHRIMPSSTDDVTNWYIPKQWVDSLSRVQTYKKLNFSTRDDSGVYDGSYTEGGKTYYAYNVKTFTLYTIRETGSADVYLDADAVGGAIVVNRIVDGVQTPVTDKVAACLRVGIAIDGELKLVYAPAEPTGHGNDVHSINNSINGWTVVKDETSTKLATYNHISGNNIDDWAINRYPGQKYYDPATAGNNIIAENVDYNGTKLQVYIWMEGTDSACTGANISGDDSEYSVSIRLAGLAK